MNNWYARFLPEAVPGETIYSEEFFAERSGKAERIERFKVGLFVPMHFVASGFESSWRMKEFTDEKDIPFWEICKEGETIEI